MVPVGEVVNRVVLGFQFCCLLLSHVLLFFDLFDQIVGDEYLMKQRAKFESGGWPEKNVSVRVGE